MEYFILIFFMLSIFYFIYESAILPTTRLNYRYKLFELRDDLRKLKFDDKINELEYKAIEHTIHTTINTLPNLTASEFINAVNKVENDENLHKQVEKRRAFINSIQNEEAKLIYDKSSDYGAYVFIFNLGSWAPIVIPIIACFFTFSKIGELVKQISALPSHQMNISNHEIYGGGKLAV